MGRMLGEMSNPYPSAAALMLAAAEKEETATASKLANIRARIQTLREVVTAETGMALLGDVGPQPAPDQMPPGLTEGCIWVVNRYARGSGISTGQVKDYLVKHGYVHGGKHFATALQKTMQRLVTDGRVDGAKIGSQWSYTSADN